MSGASRKYKAAQKGLTAQQLAIAAANNTGHNRSGIKVWKQEAIKDIENIRLEQKKKSKILQKEPLIIYNGFQPTTELIDCAKKFVRGRLSNRTKTEKLMNRWLKNCKENNRPETIIFTSSDKFYMADFYLPGRRIVIEVDGAYHSTPEQQVKDAQRTADLIKVGLTVKRIKVEDMQKNRIKAFIKEEITNIIINKTILRKGPTNN